MNLISFMSSIHLWLFTDSMNCLLSGKSYWETSFIGCKHKLTTSFAGTEWLTEWQNDLFITGFVLFFEQKIQELFKDFQGHIPHFSRTPFSAKKEPWVYVFFSSSTTWVILSRRSFCVYSFFFGVLLKLLSYRWNSRTFQHRLQLSRTFKALNFYFKI